MAKKITGMCFRCGKPHVKNVSWCPKCIEKETKAMEKRGWKRVGK